MLRMCLFASRFCLLALACGALSAVPKALDLRIEFPDIPGYRTLKCDFHIHTVFSDGRVWPTIRVEEGIREGLDVIALTDHLEYKPHLADLAGPDQNRSHEIAQVAVKGRDLLVVRGAEITRSMPPGHFNAIFVQDVNGLLAEMPTAQVSQLMRVPVSPEAQKFQLESSLKVMREAARQGAFVFWNHPAWLRQTPDGVARLQELHKQFLKENLFQGIEVANGYNGYSDEALQIALDHNLTLIGNSDIHNPVDMQYDNPWQSKLSEGGHRPVTLVFAREKTEKAIKEALHDRRTVVWWNNILIGRQQWLDPLLASSLIATPVGYLPDEANVDRLKETTVIVIEIRNTTDADFILRNVSPYRMTRHIDVLTVPPHDTVRVEVNTLSRLPEVVMRFEVLNAITAPQVHPIVTFTFRTGAGARQ